MSSFYDVMYLVKTSKPREVKAMLIAQGYLHENNIAQDDYYKEDKIMAIQGTTWISAGTGTDERHKEFIESLKAVDPKAVGLSRWHFSEFTWDDEYGEDEEGIFEGY